MSIEKAQSKFTPEWLKIDFQNIARFIITGVLIYTSGCSSIIDARKQKAPYISQYYSGNLKSAAADFKDKAADRNGSGDELMWCLDAGTSAFSAGEYKTSLKIFERCEAILKEFRDRADISARDGGGETGAVFTNANALSYRGMYVDKIMLNAYKALDYLALNNMEAAQVELRRMRDSQKNVIKHFKDEIETAQKGIDAQNIKNQQKSANMGRADTSVSFESLLKNPVIDKAYKTSGDKANKLYGNLSNPFVTYFSAMGYFLENNYGEAMVDLRNLYKMIPDNKLVQQDYVTCAKKLGDKIPDQLKEISPLNYSLNTNIVYVLFFNGRAPALKQEKFQIILPYVGYTGIAFPQYEYFQSPLKALQIDLKYKNRNISDKTEQIVDFDAVMSQEYHLQLPTMITRLVISTLTKEIGSYAAVAAARQAGSGAEIGAYALTGLYKWLFNTADTRCWETLPKEIQAARVPIPENHILTISPLSSLAGASKDHSKPTKKNITHFGKKTKIKLKKDTKVAIVYIRALSADKLIYKLFEF
jgi:hypothetical protein